MTNKLLSLSIILLLFFVQTNAQQVRIDTIPFKTFKEIGITNSNLVNDNCIPILNSSNGIVEIISTREFTDTTRWLLQKKAEWKQKNKIVDEGQQAIKFGLVKNKEKYSIRRLKTVVNYVAFPIGGGSMVSKYVIILNKDIEEVVCLFNNLILEGEYPVS